MGCWIRVALVMFFGYLSFAGNAVVCAQQADDGAVMGESEVSSVFLPSSDVSTPSGRVRISQESAGCSYELKAFGSLPVKFSLDGRYTGIDNTSPVDLPAHLNALETGLETTLPFFNLESAYLRFGLNPSFYGDSWDFTAYDFRIPARVVGIYRPSDTWTWVAGVAVYPEFQCTAFPVFGLIYKPDDVWTFHLVPQRPHINYKLNQRVVLFAEGAGGFGEYEVDKDGYKSAVLQYKEIRAGGGLEYKINDSLTGVFSTGGVFNRALKYRDSLGKVVIEDGMYVSARLQARF